MSKSSSDVHILSTVPNIKLNCSSSMSLPGAKVRLELEAKEVLSEDFLLCIELVSSSSQKLISLSTSSLKKVEVMALPKDLPVGDYDLRLVYKDWILDSKPLIISENDFVNQNSIFEEGLELRIRLTEYFQNGDFAGAFSLNQTATKRYIESGYLDIAAAAWEDFGISLLRSSQFDEAIQSFESAIKLFQAIENQKGEAAASFLLNKAYEAILTEQVETPYAVRDARTIQQDINSTPFYKLKVYQLQEFQQAFEHSIELYHQTRDVEREKASIYSCKNIYETWLLSNNEVERERFKECYRDFLGTALIVKSDFARTEMISMCSKMAKSPYQAWWEGDEPLITKTSFCFENNTEFESDPATVLGLLKKRRKRLEGVVGKFSSYLWGEVLSSLYKWIFCTKENAPPLILEVASNGRRISFSIDYKAEEKDVISRKTKKIFGHREQGQRKLVDALQAWALDESEDLEYYSMLAKTAGIEISTKPESIEGFIQIDLPKVSKS